MTANYYLDATLRAVQPVDVLNHPGGTIIRTVEPGSIVGKIFSWVQRNGTLWWQLEGSQSEFVEHAPGRFDAQMAAYTGRGKEFERMVVSDAWSAKIVTAAKWLAVAAGIWFGFRIFKSLRS
jgi:hypothetical protein